MSARTHEKTFAQQVFLEILGALLSHAVFAFRHIRNEHDREDSIQEMICIAWTWTLRLLQQQKDPRDFPSAIAAFASRHVKGGRRFVGGKLGRKDALSRHAQARFGFEAHSLPASTATTHETLYGEVGGQRRHDTFEEILQEHDRSPVPDQVAFRIDFDAYRRSYEQRRREIMDAMMTGEGTKELAETFQVSPGRISQMHREFQAAWQSFCSE